MILERLFQKSDIPLLKNSLDAAALRHEVLASNIANVSTPGYQRKDVVFEEKLQESMNNAQITGTRTLPQHLPIGNSRSAETQAEVVVDSSKELASGVNNVDMDMEMSELAKNQIEFSAAASIIARRFRGLKDAILGRS